MKIGNTALILWGMFSRDIQMNSRMRGKTKPGSELISEVIEIDEII